MRYGGVCNQFFYRFWCKQQKSYVAPFAVLWQLPKLQAEIMDQHDLTWKDNCLVESNGRTKNTCSIQTNRISKGVILIQRWIMLRVCENSFNNFVPRLRLYEWNCSLADVAEMILNSSIKNYGVAQFCSLHITNLQQFTGESDKFHAKLHVVTKAKNLFQTKEQFTWVTQNITSLPCFQIAGCLRW